MAVRILKDPIDNYSCMYCSVTMWAFGPIFYKRGLERNMEILDMVYKKVKSLATKE
jgi:hypothetical protein